MKLPKNKKTMTGTVVPTMMPPAQKFSKGSDVKKKKMDLVIAVGLIPSMPKKNKKKS